VTSRKNKGKGKREKGKGKREEGRGKRARARRSSDPFVSVAA